MRSQVPEQGFAWLCLAGFWCGKLARRRNAFCHSSLLERRSPMSRCARHQDLQISRVARPFGTTLADIRASLTTKPRSMASMRRREDTKALAQSASEAGIAQLLGALELS